MQRLARFKRKRQPFAVYGEQNLRPDQGRVSESRAFHRVPCLNGGPNSCELSVVCDREREMI